MMIGLDVTHKALTDTRAERLRAWEVGRLVAELYDFFVEYHRRTYETEGRRSTTRSRSRRSCARESSRRGAGTSTSTASRGSAEADGGRPLAATGEEPIVDVGVDLDAEGFLDLLCERLGSL